MGEARYYAKVKFVSEEQAQEALPKIEAFLKRVSEAKNDWQGNRNGGKEADDARRQRFPEVFEYLKLEPPESKNGRPPDYSNYCAGLLDSPLSSDDGEIFVRDNCVLFSGTVWHFANWESLMDAMKEHFGAVNAGYVSDEYTESDLYELTGV